MGLPADDHARISAAIQEAETRTSGEIFCVFTEAADELAVVPLAYAALAALVIPPLLLWFGIVDPAWFAGWRAGSAIAVQTVVSVHAALSAILFALTWLIVRPAPIRYRLAPKSLRAAAADRTAMESFLSHGVHTTDDRTGVLIFLSRRDHIAEIIADEGIYTRVEQDVWADTVAGMLERAKAEDIPGAFLFAIEQAGALLADHFPPTGRDPNELPDRLLEL